MPTKNEPKTTGEKIRAARLRSNLTQHELADLCGMKCKSQICEYETGRKLPGAIVLPRIAKALGVSVGRLHKGELRGPGRPCLVGGAS